MSSFYKAWLITAVPLMLIFPIQSVMLCQGIDEWGVDAIFSFLITCLITFIALVASLILAILHHRRPALGILAGIGSGLAVGIGSAFLIAVLFY